MLRYRHFVNFLKNVESTKLWPRDCHTAVYRKFGCTSFGISDIDILPFFILSKSGITKIVANNYCLRIANLDLIKTFVVSLLDAKI